jgi:hypothetical protein
MSNREKVEALVRSLINTGDNKVIGKAELGMTVDAFRSVLSRHATDTGRTYKTRFLRTVRVLMVTLVDAGGSSELPQ